MRLAKKFLPIVALGLAGCLSTAEDGQIKPGHRPDLNSTEAGLWMVMDRFERRLANSELVDRDPELNAYLNNLLCKVMPAHCQDIKLFVIKNPHFNASMAPNGSMHIWTGLLLRAQNEAQLATVLGHEAAHYLNQHSLKKWETAKATTEFLSFFSIATAGFGVGIVGLAAQIGGLGSIQSYSRDMEHEADKVGFDLLYHAGFDPREAAKLWEQVKAEKEASDDDTGSVFWSSHPPTEERIVKLKSMSRGKETKFSVSNTTQGSTFKRLRFSRWHDWADELISSRRMAESLIVFDQLKENGFDPHEVSYFKGEVYRRRGDDGDLALALESYKEAAQITPAPLKTYKKMGLVYQRQQKTAEAISHYETYLEQNPNAGDTAIVHTYIHQLRK